MADTVKLADVTAAALAAADAVYAVDPNVPGYYKQVWAMGVAAEAERDGEAVPPRPTPATLEVELDSADPEQLRGLRRMAEAAKESLLRGTWALEECRPRTDETTGTRDPNFARHLQREAIMADGFTAGTLVRHKLSSREMVTRDVAESGRQRCDWADAWGRPHSEEFSVDWLEEARPSRPAASRPSLAARIRRFFGCG